MKIRDIEAYFQTLYPAERGCPWDNDGLLFCPDREGEVSRILTCLDVTFAAIERAAMEDCKLIVSHHPLIFSPIKRINEDSLVGQKLLLLMQYGISLLSLHTRFDGAVGGLNERFGQAMGLFPLDEPPLLPEEPFIGSVGALSEKMSPEDFASLVASSVESTVKIYSAGMKIKSVAFCCGSAKDLVPPALSRGYDAFVGGDIPYHVAQEAAERGMTVVDCGHHASEKKATFYLADALGALSTELFVVPFSEAIGGDFVDF